MTKPGQVRIGTSGWIYRHWRGVFYPPVLPTSRWFAHYAQHFDTVEINNTFYRLPSEEAFDTWRRQAPPGFVYAIKASRYLTHRKKLKDAAEPLQNLLGRARRLGPHLGPILYQLPPHWRADPGRLREFLALLPRDLRHVFEFRDPTWCDEAIRALLSEARVGTCLHDMHGFDCPAWVTGRVVYVRFHGPSAVKYAGSYAAAHLRTWAERLRAFQESGHDVYAYFNNDEGGHAVANARELRRLVAAVPAAAPT